MNKQEFILETFHLPQENFFELIYAVVAQFV